MTYRLYFDSDQLAAHVKIFGDHEMNGFRDELGNLKVDYRIEVNGSYINHRTSDIAHEQVFKSGNLYVSSAVPYRYNGGIIDSKTYNGLFGNFKLTNWRVVRRPQTDALITGVDEKTEIPQDPISDMQKQIVNIQNSLRLLHQQNDVILDHLKLLVSK